MFLVRQNVHALKLAHRAYVMVGGNITISGTGKSCWHGPIARGLPQADDTERH